MKSVKPSKEQFRITINREYKPNALVRVKVINNEKPLRGKVLARATFPDIYQWYIVKLRGFQGHDSYLTVRHDHLSIRKAKKAKK